MSIAQSRVVFGLAVGALLAAVLVAATDIGPLAAVALAEPQRSVFSSYMTAQMVWLVAVAAGAIGFAVSRLVRGLPRSVTSLTIEAIGVGGLCAVLLVSGELLAHVVVVGALTYAIGRWLEVHPVATRRPDMIVYVSLAAGFLAVYWRPTF